MSRVNIQEPRSLSLHVKCSQNERERWSAKARSHGLSLSEYLREFLEASRSSRRKPAPPIDPSLMVQIRRSGINLNQIAKAVNGTLSHGNEIDTLAVHGELITIERVLKSFRQEHRE